MTDRKLQPITGPGEYTQRNGKMAEIVRQDRNGCWLGWVTALHTEKRAMGMWDTSGKSGSHSSYDIVQPKPEKCND